MARRSSRGLAHNLLLVAIGLALLVVAYQGSPSAILAKITGWLTAGGSTSAGSVTTAGAPATPAATPAVTTGGKKPAVKRPAASSPSGGIPTITPSGQPATLVPVTSLTPWQKFVHWVQSNNPFNHGGVAP